MHKTEHPPLRLVGPDAQNELLKEALACLHPYLENYWTGKGLRDDTIREKLAVIYDFYTCVRKELGHITKEDFESWSAHLIRKRKLTRDSARKYQLTILEHLDYQISHENVRKQIEQLTGGRIIQVATKDNMIPGGGVQRPKMPMTRAEINAFFAAIKKAIPRSLRAGKKNYRTYQRDLAMFYLMYWAGMRPHEAGELHLDAFRSDIGRPKMGQYATVTFYGKAAPRKDKKSRTVRLLSEDLPQIMGYYVEHVRPFLRSMSNPFVFVTERERDDSGVTDSQINYRFHHICDLAGFEKGKYTPHCLRVSLATHLEEIGVPLSTVQGILGHEHLHTSLIYTKPLEKRIQADLKRIDLKFFSGQKP